MSHRPEQVAATLRRAVQAVLDRGLQDPRVSGMVTVTAVRVSPDLRSATVSVSVYPAERQELTMHGLHSAAAHIRHDISDAVGLRRTPDLTFRLDESLKKQAAVLDAIARATGEGAPHREDRDWAPRHPGATPDTENGP
jgi:ribosome-binding factor A